MVCFEWLTAPSGKAKILKRVVGEGEGEGGGEKSSLFDIGRWWMRER